MEREQPASSFSTPSPGEILKRQALRGVRADAGAPAARGTANAAVPGQVFALGHRVAANQERGVLLAPMIVQWNYAVGDPQAFTKWLRMKEIILSDARLAIVDDMRGAHYFGTYIAADGPLDEANGDLSGASGPCASGTPCQTIWGFSRREAMTRFFAIGRGEVARKTIVETDLADFLTGLKGFVTTGGGLFRQSVLVSPQVE